MVLIADLAAGSELASLVTTFKKAHLEAVLLPILVQLCIILLTARVFAYIGRKFGQPDAVGEILAGLALGPSLLGRLWPEAQAYVFHPHIHGTPAELHALFDALLNWIFVVLSQLGLILMLFLIGLEFDFSHLRQKGRAAAAISISGIICPFALGWGLAYLIHPYIRDASTGKPEFIGFSLFMGTAMSITALPILGRIMMEMGFTKTKLGTITISAAAIDDVAGWLILASVAALVRGNLQWQNVVGMVLATLAFGGGLLFVVGPLLRHWARAATSGPREHLSAFNFALLLVLIFSCSIVTNVIGIFAIFGSFLLGATLSPEQKFREAVERKIHDVVIVFFLPIFFTYTGLRTRVDTLDQPVMWLICAGVLGTAIFGKFGGCALAARWSGFSARESICVGTLMNTRGLMELIVINAGKDLGVIPDSVFCMLVIMAIVTTIMTTPLLLWFMRGTELEPHVLQSRFYRPQTA